MPRDTVAFISYARADGEGFASSLRERLERDEPEISLWMDRSKMEGGVDFADQICRAIDSVQYLVLVMTPAAMRSEWVQRERRYAREQGVCVCPVKGAPEAELAEPRRAMPGWMSRAHIYDLEKEWQRFTNFLKMPCQATRVPFMAPPLSPLFVERAADSVTILGQILDQAHKNPSGRLVALRGAPGFGKTTLASGICHNGEVMTACDGGVLWATLGERPSPLRELGKMYAALTGERPQFLDADDAAIHLFGRLAGKRCLMVVDDVWDFEHLKPFLREPGQVTRIITTRLSTIAVKAADPESRIDVAELTPAESERLLLSKLRTPPKGTGPFQPLAKRLARWPLLLELANGALREQLDFGDTLEGALAWVNEALDQMKVVAFDAETPTARNQAVASTVEISLKRLGEKRQRCLELSVFPDDADIPFSAPGIFWREDEFKTRLFLQRLGELFIVKMNLAAHTFRLHDATRAYLATQLSDPARVHGALADAWVDLTSVKEEYPLRYAVYHLAEAMLAPEQLGARAVQLACLLADTHFSEYQKSRGDAVAIHSQLAKALERVSKAPDPEAAFPLAAIALGLRSYSVSHRPARIFELARQGQLEFAEKTLDLFEVEPEWRTAAQLMIGWLGGDANPEQSGSLVEATAAQCTSAELQTMLARCRQPTIVPPSGPACKKPTLWDVSKILERAGGTGSATSVEPLVYDGPGLPTAGTGYIAEQDGPRLVAFAMLDPPNNTQYLRQYIAIHAANPYRDYRNRSLWVLLKPVMQCRDVEWVRSIIEALITSALSVTSIDFEDSLPLAIQAIRARGGDAKAAAAVESYRQRLEREASVLFPERGKSDSWSHYQRRTLALAEAYVLALGQAKEAKRLLRLAETLPHGFAGFRAASCLTMAEAFRIVQPGDASAIDSSLKSALAAAHRIQDYSFCLQMTSIVNSMRSRWCRAQGFDIEAVHDRFLSDPDADEFCAVHCVGERFRFRGEDQVPIPESVLQANTLRTVAAAHRRPLRTIETTNAGIAPDESLPPGREVNIPDPDFAPFLAARLAAEALASYSLSPQRRTALIQKLVPIAVGDITTLDRILARLVLSAKPTGLPLPRFLRDLELPSWSSEITTSEDLIA
jgi:hypothetical protein